MRGREYEMGEAEHWTWIADLLINVGIAAEDGEPFAQHYLRLPGCRSSASQPGPRQMVGAIVGNHMLAIVEDEHFRGLKSVEKRNRRQGMGATEDVHQKKDGDGTWEQ